MKKVLSVLTVLVIVSMLFACANGGSGDSDKAPVRVSFNVETPHEDISKVATVNDAGSSFTYWYKAEPQWTGDDFTAIQGATAGKQGAVDGYVQITDYAAGANIGLFAQGSWKFYAQVKLNGSVVYQSETTPANVPITYINSTDLDQEGKKQVTLNVARAAGNGTANVTIAIEVPNTSASSNLTAKYSGQTSGTVTISKVAATEHTGGNWSRYTGTATGLASGSYLFTLKSTDGTNEVGGAVLAFDVLPGDNRAITGTIENGVWQTTLMTINVPTFEMSIEADEGATSVAKNTNLEYTCSATATNITGNITYQWYVDGKAVAQNGTSSTYTFNQANPGYYYVSCEAKIAGKAVGSSSLIVTVTN